MDSRNDKSKHKKQEPIIEDDVNQKLFQWFEKRGLLLELRAHMRQQMVRALQENVTGLNTSRKRLSSSPKFQAMHMIIADFLLQQEHHYTVSVFSTEVPVLNSLPEFSQYVTDILKASKEGTLAVTTSAPRFSAIDIQDILETVGLPPHTQAGAYAAELYAESGEALLTCIVRALSALHGVVTSQHNLSPANNQLSMNCSSIKSELNDYDEEALECSNQDNEHWTSEMRKILLQSDIKIQHINKLQEKMKKFHENEIRKVREEEASRYKDLCAQQEENVERRVREEVNEEFAERERESEKQKENLHGLALQLRAEYAEITDRLSQLRIQSDKIEDKKKQQEKEFELIEKQKIEIALQEKQIEESYARLTVDQENFRREREPSRSCPEEKPNTNVDVVDKEEFQKMVQQYSTVKEKLEEIKTKLTDYDGVLVLRESRSTNSTQTESPNFVNREQQTVAISQLDDAELIQQLQGETEKISRLQEEIVDLQAYVLQQRCRIDQLTHRATSLATQLEEAQQSIAQHECQERMIAIPTAPILHPRPHTPLLQTTTYPYINWQPPQTGAGEESFFTPRHVPQQPSTRHEARRRPLKFNYRQNVSPTSEDSSPTDEILLEARRRLRDLEEESAAVNRSYRQFQARQLEDSNTIVINRNVPNSQVNRVAPLPSQTAVRREPVFNHLRLRAQVQISDDSDNDDLDVINLRRNTLSSRHRHMNRFFVPSDNPLISKKLNFTIFKHFSKYASFKKRFGKSSMRKYTIGSRSERRLGREQSTNQSEQLDVNPAITEDQVCQNNLYFCTERNTSFSDSSSDSDSFFDRNEAAKYKTTKITPRQMQHYKQVEPTIENFEHNVENVRHIVKNDSEKPGMSQVTSEKPGLSKVSSEKHSSEDKRTIKETPLPKIMNPLSSAISSSSLAVESIPKDDSNNDIFIKSTQEINSEHIVDGNIIGSDNKFIEIEEVPVVDYHTVAANTSVLLEEQLLPLTVPNLSLLNEEATREELQGLEYQGEENVDLPLSAVPISVTSGSDIFRELDVSQSESSEAISAPPRRS